MNKYNAKKVKVGGMTFDSTREYNRWCELRLLERAGEIKDLKRQVEFQLLPSNRTPSGKTVKGVKYIADFTYYDERGAYIVEDAKGYKTEGYTLKKKMLLDRYGYWIKET